MPTISYLKPPLAIHDPSNPPPQPKAEDLETNTIVELQGAITVAIRAPKDDQLLFNLVPAHERTPEMMKKVWVKATVAALQPTVNQMFEQALIQTRLTPVVRHIQAGFCPGPQGELVYLFQVPVSNTPTGYTAPEAPKSLSETPVAANDSLDVLNPVL